MPYSLEYRYGASNQNDPDAEPENHRNEASEGEDRDALGPFHNADGAFIPQPLCPCPGIAHAKGTDEREEAEECIELVPRSEEISADTEEEKGIGEPVENGIEECAGF